jgi:hypothetical protein
MVEQGWQTFAQTIVAELAAMTFPSRFGTFALNVETDQKVISCQ